MDNIKDKWLIEYEPMTNEFCFYRTDACCFKDKTIAKCDRDTCPLRVKLKSETQTANNK